jgi:hypothetical protein
VPGGTGRGAEYGAERGAATRQRARFPDDSGESRGGYSHVYYHHERQQQRGFYYFSVDQRGSSNADVYNYYAQEPAHGQ